MRTWTRCWTPLALLGMCLTVLPRPVAAQACIGDCNADRMVTIDELILGVHLALQGGEGCDAVDVNRDGRVTIDELVRAVVFALDGCPPVLAFITPTEGLLVQAGTVAARIALPPGVDGDTIAIELDDVNVTGQLDLSATEVFGELTGVAPGPHRLTASAEVDTQPLFTAVEFEAVALTDPDECEVLNQAECLLPYPSSRFLVADARTATGYRVHVPAGGLPMPNGPPISPDPINQLDGFSPTVQILMHFPQGVDLERSDASRLLAPDASRPGPPWIDTRTYDGRSLDADSPSVLIDADTGERVLHFLENDGHAEGDAARQALIMRPGVSLVPAHRYIVAMRNLRTADGSAVVAEPAFAALRDNRPTNIPAIESRRPAMDAIFTTLAANGIARGELILAFDFIVQSEQQLTGAMLSMRDQAYAWALPANADDNTEAVTRLGGAALCSP